MASPQDAQPMDLVSTQEGYDRWASIYDEEDNPLVALEEPEVDRLLGDVAGLNVADVGCGTGRHSFRLAARGARVTALDLSEGMLAKARAKPGAEAIKFIQHDVAKRLPLDSRSCDAVVCGLVLEHVADLRLLFGEMGRICRPAGRIVASAMHPAMMLRGITARFTDPRTGRETRPHSHQHQICDFVMAAVEAGLKIDHLSEHAVDEGLVARSPRAGKYLHWPLLFMMGMRPGAGLY